VIDAVLGTLLTVFGGIEEGFAYAKPYSEQKQRVNSGQGRSRAAAKFISTLELKRGTLCPLLEEQGGSVGGRACTL